MIIAMIVIATVRLLNNEESAEMLLRSNGVFLL